MATTSYDVRRVAAVVAAGVLASGCSGEGSAGTARSTPRPGPSATAAVTEAGPAPSVSPDDPTPTASPEPKPFPVSLPAYFRREPDGGDLRLGAVRERTAAYTSYDASYRSGQLRVTGVLNIPT